jgi:hypothetical protein
VTALSRKKAADRTGIYSEDYLLREYDAMHFGSKVLPVWKNVLPPINQSTN